MNRIIVLAIVAISTGTQVNAQYFNSNKFDSTNVYRYSLIKYCNYLASNERESNTLYIQKDQIVSDYLPDSIGKYKLVYLDSRDIKDHLNRRATITVIRIFPMRLEGHKLTINIIPYSVSYRRKAFNYINGGGYVVNFRFDCSTDRLIYLNSKSWGI